MLSTVSPVRLVSHRFLSSHHNVTHFHKHFTTPALSTPAMSTPANSAFPLNIPLHLKRVATLPCEMLLSAVVVVEYLYGSVEIICFRCGGVFDNRPPARLFDISAFITVCMQMKLGAGSQVSDVTCRRRLPRVAPAHCEQELMTSPSCVWSWPQVRRRAQTLSTSSSPPA